MESQLSYSESQWDLLLALFILAAFALLASFVFLISTRSEISPRYRPSSVGRGDHRADRLHGVRVHHHLVAHRIRLPAL